MKINQIHHRRPSVMLQILEISAFHTKQAVGLIIVICLVANCWLPHSTRRQQKKKNCTWHSVFRVGHWEWVHAKIAHCYISKRVNWWLCDLHCMFFGCITVWAGFSCECNHVSRGETELAEVPLILRAALMRSSYSFPNPNPNSALNLKSTAASQCFVFLFNWTETHCAWFLQALFSLSQWLPWIFITLKPDGLNLQGGSRSHMRPTCGKLLWGYLDKTDSDVLFFFPSPQIGGRKHNHQIPLMIYLLNLDPLAWSLKHFTSILPTLMWHSLSTVHWRLAFLRESFERQGPSA